MTTRNWVNNGGIALSAQNLNSLEADLDAALGVPDAALAGRVVAGATKTALDASYVPRWKPNTAYTLGQQVVLPDNQIGSAKAAFTSGATYDATKWTLFTALDLLTNATSASEVVLRTNYILNPSVGTTMTGWAMNNSGGATTAAIWSQGAPGAGASSYRATVTTAPTGAGFGPKITNPVGTVPGKAGDAMAAGVWVYPSVACNMFVSLAVFNGATQGSGANGSTVAVPAGTWTRLTVSIASASADYDNVRIWPQVATADVSKFTATNTIAYDAAQFERGSTTLGTYFDGDTATAGNITQRWAGASGASVSYQMDNTTLVRRSPTGSIQVGAPVGANDALNRAYIESQGTYYVLSEGAKGDATDAGGTDDTAAIQAVYDKARGSFGFGGTVEWGPRAFKLDGSVKTYSNIKSVANGAVIRKYSTNTNYSAFETLSNGATGYGSGGSNIVFEGFTFQGVFGTGSTGIAVTMHHAQNVTFRKCTWTEAIISGHAIDLLGCNGVLVDDCVFKGFKVTANREYVEAIQCDYSMNGAGGSESNVASWDGLPTINVTVRNSKFLPLANAADSTKPWAAPNPLGSHSRLDGKWIEGIKFLDNYVEGGIATDSTAITDGFAVLTRGWIHFFCARNIEIIGNTFNNTRKYQDSAVTGTPYNAFGKPVAARVLMCYPISTGTLMADIQNASAPSQSMTPMPVANLVVERNTYIGFSSDGSESLADIRGTSANKFRDVSFIKNSYIDCSSAPGTPQDKGSDAIYLQDGVGVDLVGNNMRFARGLIYAFRVNKLRINGGNIRDIGAYAGRFSECSDVNITDVFLENFGCAWYTYNNAVADSTASPQAATAGFSVTGGSIIQGYTSAQLSALGGGSFAQPITMSGVQQFYISKVRAPFNAATGYLQLAYCYGTPVNGRVEDNIAIGWNAQVQASTAVGVLKGTGTGVVSQNNML